MFGDRVRQYRQAAGWSQLELAQKVGVTEGAVSSWEQGRTGATAANVAKMEDLFKLEEGRLGYLLGYAPAPDVDDPQGVIVATNRIAEQYKPIVLAAVDAAIQATRNLEGSP